MVTEHLSLNLNRCRFTVYEIRIAELMLDALEKGTFICCPWQDDYNGIIFCGECLRCNEMFQTQEKSTQIRRNQWETGPWIYEINSDTESCVFIPDNLTPENIEHIKRVLTYINNQKPSAYLILQ
jgi:hypothetical protein